MSRERLKMFASYSINSHFRDVVILICFEKNMFPEVSINGRKLQQANINFTALKQLPDYLNIETIILTGELHTLRRTHVHMLFLELQNETKKDF